VAHSRALILQSKEAFCDSHSIVHHAVLSTGTPPWVFNVLRACRTPGQWTPKFYFAYYIKLKAPVLRGCLMGFSRCSHTTRFGSTASPVALALFLQILGPPWNTFLLRHVYLVGLVRMIYPLPLRLFIKPYLPTQGFRMPLGSHNQNPTVFTLRVQCREAINRAPVICDMR